MQISFGKKIPIAQCQIYDNQQQKFVKAVISEFDCKDKSDITEIKSLGPNWQYKETISSNMGIKNFLITKGRKYEGRFLAIENPEGEIIGISHFDDLKRKSELRFLESRKDHRYKYVGQNLIATIGKILINTNQSKLIVRSAVPTAIDFYEKTCGFKNLGHYDLEMDNDDIQRFIKQTEDRTETKIIDLQG